MGFDKAASISISRLNDAILRAAKSHSDLIDPGQPPGWWRNPEILGSKLRDIDFGGFTPDVLLKVATQIKVDAGLPGRPGVSVFDGGIIVGSYPFDNFISFGP